MSAGRDVVEAVDTGPVAGAAADGSGGRNWSLWLGLGLVGLVVVLAVVSFVWTPYDPYYVDSANRYAGPGPTNLLGTDRFGRDVLSRLMVGARTTLFVGIVSVGVAGVVGTPLGVAMGMAPSWLQWVLVRGNDLLLAFPALLLAIMFAAIRDPSTATAMVAIGIATIPIFARIARSGTVQVMSTEYVAAARAAGRGGLPIAVRHVLPNITSLLLVQASVSFAIAILAEAALSFLQFGTPSPIPSWGLMLYEAQEVLTITPGLSVWPGVAIAMAVLGFNLLGDGLRDRFDPRLAGQT